MMYIEANLLYFYQKNILDDELKAHEASVKHHLREQLIAMREMHEEDLKLKEQELLADIEKTKQDQLKSFEEKQRHMEHQFTMAKDDLENEKRADIKKEFDHLLLFERENSIQNDTNLMLSY